MLAAVKTSIPAIKFATEWPPNLWGKIIALNKPLQALGRMSDTHLVSPSHSQASVQAADFCGR